MKKWLFVVLFFFPSLAFSAEHIAASCASSAVQTAMTAATESGAIVTVPTCSATHWTDKVTWSAPANAVLRGSTTCTGHGNPTDNNLACTDNTTIVDDYDSGNSIINIDTNASGSFTMYGLSVTNGDADAHDHGFFRITGSSTDVEIYNNHINNTAGTSASHGNMAMFSIFGVLGVAHDNILDLPPGSPGNGFKIFSAGSTAVSDAAWNTATGFGSSAFFFVEDNFINGTYGTDSNDCQIAGKFVWRYNKTGGVQEHGTGSSGRGRGCRAAEIYGNKFFSSTSVVVGHEGEPQFAVAYMATGPAMIWGNTGTSGSGSDGFKNFLYLTYNRRNNVTYSETPPPNGWGYCGTDSGLMGAGTNWDQNNSASTGYACLDQVGRGLGDLLSGEFPNVQNVTNGGAIYSSANAWPRQAVEPLYEWLNTWNNPGWGGFFDSTLYGIYTENTDYYLCRGAKSALGTGECSAFAGTAGVGSGTRAARPASTTNGVAYWSTDQGGNWNARLAGANDGCLDIVVAGAWSNCVYTPYTYPHPSIAVDCTPEHLTFTAQPSNTYVGVSVGTVTVGIYDSGNNLCTSASNTITLSKHAGTCTGMTLNGTVSGAAGSGLFSTNDVNMTVATGDCSLDAAASGLTGTTSNTFNISTAPTSSGAGPGRIRARIR